MSKLVAATFHSLSDCLKISSWCAMPLILSDCPWKAVFQVSLSPLGYSPFTLFWRPGCVRKREKKSRGEERRKRGRSLIRTPSFPPLQLPLSLGTRTNIQLGQTLLLFSVLLVWRKLSILFARLRLFFFLSWKLKSETHSLFTTV